MGDAKGVRIGERKLALKIESANEPDQEKEYIQIFCTTNYVEEWLRIDKMIYCITGFLLSAKDREDIVELVVSIEELKDTLMEILGIDIIRETNYEKVMRVVQETLRDVEADIFRLRALMNDIRIIYEDFRINFLSNS